MSKLTAASKIVLSGSVAGGAVLMAALICAPLAAADPALNSDEKQFISDLADAGQVGEGGAAGAVRAGWQVCNDVSSGVDNDQVAIRIAQASASAPSGPGQTNLTLSDAQEFVSIALSDLCPSVS